MTDFESYITSEGYPTEDALQRIKDWEARDGIGLLKFIEENLWTYPQYIKQKDGTWHLSTCGWSGNEDIINAMTENQVWWSLYWTSSVRGGHYVFDPIRYKIDV